MNSVPGVGADPENAGIPDSVSGTLAIWGDVRLESDAFLQAQVQGNVEAKRKLVLAGTAEVSGRVHGFDVCLEGKVSGGVEAEDQVWLKRGGWLRQRCVARALRIERGADFQGELRVGAVTP